VANQVEVVAMQPFGLLVVAREQGQPIESLPPGWFKDQVREHRLLLLRGFAPFPTAESLSEYCTTWGPLMQWSFGSVLELVEHASPTDQVFDCNCVPFHWDGMYAKQLPAYQFFHCINAIDAADGGRTIFCDSSRVWADVDPETRARWQNISVTYTLPAKAHYGGQLTAPLVCAHPGDGPTVLRFNEPSPAGAPLLNPPSLSFDGLSPDAVDAFIEELRALLYSPRYMYAHAWQTGDTVVADNYVLLHGRTAFTSRAPRHIRRVQILEDPPRAGSDAIRPAMAG
jgi:alpha-ketoglutarate-dependent taurine dioxygenase